MVLLLLEGQMKLIYLDDFRIFVTSPCICWPWKLQRRFLRQTFMPLSSIAASIEARWYTMIRENEMMQDNTRVMRMVKMVKSCQWYNAIAQSTPTWPRILCCRRRRAHSHWNCWGASSNHEMYAKRTHGCKTSCYMTTPLLFWYKIPFFFPRTF